MPNAPSDILNAFLKTPEQAERMASPIEPFIPMAKVDGTPEDITERLHTKGTGSQQPIVVTVQYCRFLQAITVIPHGDLKSLPKGAVDAMKRELLRQLNDLLDSAIFGR